MSACLGQSQSGAVTRQQRTAQERAGGRAGAPRQAGRSVFPDSSTSATRGPNKKRGTCVCCGAVRCVPKLEAGGEARRRRRRHVQAHCPAVGQQLKEVTYQFWPPFARWTLNAKSKNSPVRKHATCRPMLAISEIDFLSHQWRSRGDGKVPTRGDCASCSRCPPNPQQPFPPQYLIFIRLTWSQRWASWWGPFTHLTWKLSFKTQQTC